LPCVVTNVGGNPEAVVDGRNGFVVGPGDYRAAADRILALLDDGEQRQRMGDAALRIVEERFTTTAMMRRLTACYEDLLERAPRPKWTDQR
jgi:glycosyltransferase involved in cell wall biosynthesis